MDLVACCIRSGRSGCRSPARLPAGLVDGAACSIRQPERVGKGIDAMPLALLTAARSSRAGQDGLEAVRIRTAGVQRGALRDLVRRSCCLQSHLPLLNPDGKGPLTALGYKDTAGVDHPGADTAVIFNTVCSFVTNTNLQHYSGEQHLSYFSQFGAIVWLQFVTPACGLAVMLAVIRGLRGEQASRRFLPGYDPRDLASCSSRSQRSWRSLLVATGVPMTLRGAVAGDDARAGHADDRRGPRRGRGGDQAARHQRRRLLRAELGSSVREPEPVEQPARGGLDHHHPDGLDRDVRA